MNQSPAKKKIAIVGAGPGGLTSAMLLASRGFDVTVFEKPDHMSVRARRKSDEAIVGPLLKR